MEITETTPSGEVAPVSDSGGWPSDEFGDDADEGIEAELPWMEHLPDRSQRLLAEEMAVLFSEAAVTGDLAEVHQALREWRSTAEVCADPALAERLRQPIVVTDGELVPRPGA